MSDNKGGNTAAKGCILLVFLSTILGVSALAAAVLFLDSDDFGGPSERSPQGDPAAPSPTQRDTPRTKAPVSEGGAALQRIRARGTLLVGMDTGEPPFTGTPPMYFPAATGDPDGFDYALAAQIAEQVGVPVKIVHAKYSELEDLLLDPEAKIDLVASGYAPTDTEGLSWSKPYLEFGLCLVVPSKSKVKTVADLFGKPIGIFDDDAAADEVGRLVKGYTDLVRLEDGYWDQLVDGRFAAFLYDYPYAAAEIAVWYKQNPSRRGTLRIAQYNLTDSHYAVGVRAGDADLLTLVDTSIAAWRDSDAYAVAIKTYLKGGESVEAPAGARSVVVQKGDTLSLIAKRELGSVDKWPELWSHNQDRFPNPHLIDVGDQVVLPP